MTSARFELRRLREQLDMTQAELAKALGTRQSHISEQETGKRLIRPERILAVQRLLAQRQAADKQKEQSR